MLPLLKYRQVFAGNFPLTALSCNKHLTKNPPNGGFFVFIVHRVVPRAAYTVLPVSIGFEYLAPPSLPPTSTADCCSSTRAAPQPAAG